MTPSGDTFVRGLSAARRGAEATVWELLALCREYLLRVAANRLDPTLRAKANPSDLVHEALLEAYRDFAAFRGQSEAEWLGWLRRLLIRNIANFERQYFGTTMRQAQREVSLAAGGADSAVSPEPSPSEVLIAGERERTVGEHLQCLPEDYRQVILWHHQDGLPFDEIGRRLGRSADAVRRVWSRAIDRLQEVLCDPDRAD
jgi:RNA polymerase sigma-70 factor (ECF subfamily)